MTPRGGLFRLLRELYQSRLLIQALTVRDLRARYRSSVLGYLWTLLNPLMLMAVYALVFAVYMRAGDKFSNYALFMCTGLLPWLWIASALGDGATSIMRNSQLVTLSCFPPQVLPTVDVLTHLCNYLFALPVYMIWAAVVGFPPSAALLMLPVVAFCQLMLVLGGCLAVSALTVFYRDVQFLVGNFLTFWFFLTPILYDISMVPQRFAPLVQYLNPVSPLMKCYQDILYWRRFPDPTHLGASFGYGLAALVIGMLIFQRYRYLLAEEL